MEFRDVLEQSITYKITSAGWNKWFDIKYMKRENDKFILYSTTIDGEAKVEKELQQDDLLNTTCWEYLPSIATEIGREELIEMLFQDVINYMYEEVKCDLDNIDFYKDDPKYFTLIFTPYYQPSYKSDEDENIKYTPEIRLEGNCRTKKLELKGYVSLHDYEGNKIYLGNELDLYRLEHLENAKNELINLQSKLLQRFPELIEKKVESWEL